jgi:hypothetical protein
VDGVPNFVYRRGDRESDVVRLRAGEALGAGPHRIEVRFAESDGAAAAAPGVRRPRSAEITMSVDGSVVASGRVDAVVGSAFMYQGGALGHSTGSALTDDYAGRFAFTGVIEYVDFDLAERR